MCHGNGLSAGWKRWQRLPAVGVAEEPVDDERMTNGRRTEGRVGNRRGMSVRVVCLIAVCLIPVCSIAVCSAGRRQNRLACIPHCIGACADFPEAKRETPAGVFKSAANSGSAE